MTIIFKEDFVVAMQKRLYEPTKWKDFMKVEISDARLIHNPYRTDVSIQTLTRSVAYTSATPAQTDEEFTIDASFLVSEVIDRADLAQSGYLSQMESADHFGDILNEKIESYIYSQHALWTDVGDVGAGVIGAGTGAITVTINNIDEIMDGVDQLIAVAKGETLANRNGKFIVWRPADFSLLRAYARANGFVSADNALSNGIKSGFHYGGFTHYQSNLLTASHLFAGVKKIAQLNILRSTYGQIVVDEKDPGLISGVGITARLDLKCIAWAKTKPIVFDLNVA
jgi:hypothetical protein